MRPADLHNVPSSRHVDDRGKTQTRAHWPGISERAGYRFDSGMAKRARMPSARTATVKRDAIARAREPSRDNPSGCWSNQLLREQARGHQRSGRVRCRSGSIHDRE